jgi:hypothetical protein
MHQPAKMAQMVVRDVLCRSHTMKPARRNAQTIRPPMTHLVQKGPHSGTSILRHTTAASLGARIGMPPVACGVCYPATY